MAIDLKGIGRVLGRGLRLRCPRCGAAPLFCGPFSMYPDCLSCDLLFEREQGYFVGAIYINYGITTILAIAGFFVLDHFTSIPITQQLILWGSFCILFPLAFFRHSRSLWLILDYIFNPPELPRDRGRVSNGDRRPIGD